jgi:hypothetical protein
MFEREKLSKMQDLTASQKTKLAIRQSYKALFGYSHPTWIGIASHPHGLEEIEKF